jgi:hypothetical protein
MIMFKRTTVALSLLIAATSPSFADEPNAHWIRVQSISPGQWSVTGGDGTVELHDGSFQATLTIDPRRSRNPETQMVEGPGLSMKGHVKGGRVDAALIHQGVQTVPSQVNGRFTRSISSDPHEPGLLVSLEADKMVFSGPDEFITIDFIPTVKGHADPANATGPNRGNWVQ